MADDVTFMVGPEKGRWSAVRTHQFDEGLTDEQRERIAELEAMGYAAGLHDATDLSGVVRHDEERAFDGTRLHTSAHAATTTLIDIKGTVLHRWAYPFRKAFPDYPPIRIEKMATFWRRTHLMENGDLIAIYEGLGIIRIDKDSNLIWKSNVSAHHDLDVTEGGRLVVLTREAHMIPQISATDPVLEDFVSVLDENTGEQLFRLSLIKALRGSEFEQDWSGRLSSNGDLFHTNSIEVLDGGSSDRNPAFAKGNVLVSLLKLDLVAVFDLREQRITWGRVGPYKLQHDPHVLDNGNVMVFDNQGAGPQTSRVLELDPETWETVWSFEGDEAEPFYSETCGLAQQLPNGNTLITESDYGRALEVTSEGDVVWEFYNPQRAGPEGQYIATLMEMVHLPEDFPLDWASGPR